MGSETFSGPAPSGWASNGLHYDSADQYMEQVARAYALGAIDTRERQLVNNDVLPCASVRG